MGKVEVRDELYVIIDRGRQYAFEEMRPLSVLGPSFVPGNGFTKLVLRRVIFDRMKGIEMSVKNAITLAMDYSEELARDENADGTRYKRKFLNNDIFYKNYEGGRKDELRDTLVGHFDEMAHDMEPLVRVDADGFWDAAVKAYSKYEAEEIIRRHFSFVEKVSEEFGDEIEMTSTLGPFGFDYTEEAMRVLPKVERRLRRELLDEADDVYGTRYGSAAEKGKEMKKAGSEGGRKAKAKSEGFGGTKEVSDGVQNSSQQKTAESQAASSETRSDKRVERLRRRVEELESQKEKLEGTNEKLKEEIGRLRQEKEDLEQENEDLRERLEKEDKESESESEAESYSAEDWLG